MFEVAQQLNISSVKRSTVKGNFFAQEIDNWEHLVIKLHVMSFRNIKLCLHFFINAK